MNNNVDEVVKKIKSKIDVKGSYIGVIISVSYSEFADEITDKKELTFEEIGIRTLGKDMMQNKVIFGKLGDKNVIVMLGRIHYSRGYEAAEVATPIYVLKELGCEKLILCNSVGAITKKFRVGDIFTAEDHLNFTARNPLYKCDCTEKYGKRFIDMSDAYDKELIDLLVKTAKEEMAIKVKKGVFLEMPGPSAETPAESNFMAELGADVEGFNNCSEVIAAKYCKLPVITYALVTNYAAAYTNNKIKHEDIVYNRKCGGTYYLELLSRLIKNI